MKPQARKLVEHLNNGGVVTRESAWTDFGIQNLTARLSELTAIGYDIIKTPSKVLVHGRKIKVSAWKLRHTFTPGCHVKVVKDSGTYISPLGKTGVVQSVNLSNATACIFIDGFGYRSLKFAHLERLSHLPAGTRVTIKPAPYIVLDFHPGVNSYTITSANADHTIVAHRNLVEIAQ